MLKTHQEAIDSKVSAHHEFLSHYYKKKKVVYGFVEGKDDPCFYRGFIQQNIPEDWNIELFPAGSKDKVLKIHSSLNWKSLPKKRIAFFVDQDLSKYTDENITKDENIYITDGYSIENSIVKKETCKVVLQEVCNINQLEYKEFNKLLTLFEREFNRFVVKIISIMAWIIYWQRNNQKPLINGILLKKIFSIEKGKVKLKEHLNKKRVLSKYIHKQAKITFDPKIKISQTEKEFQKYNTYKKFIRGKYVLWFLIEFCVSVHKDLPKIFTSITKPPKMKVVLTQSNAILIFGPRTRIPYVTEEIY